MDAAAEQHASQLAERVRDLEAAADVARGKINNLEKALLNARWIGAAMGIIMATHKVTNEQAFEVLRKASQNSHRKLHEIAEDVLLTGVSPAGVELTVRP